MRVYSCLIVAALALVSGCASSAYELQAKQASERLANLQAQLGRHDQQIAELQNQFFLANDQLGQLRRREEAAKPPPALQVIRLVPDEPPAAVLAVARAPKHAPIEEPPAELNIDGDDEPQSRRAASVPTDSSPGATARNEEAAALFRDALAAFREGRAQEAIELFDHFVGRFPSHDNADRALYWMGSARLEARSFENAIGDFRALLTRYPKSSKVPDALLGLGLGYERLGAPDKARQAFVDLVRNYPNTAQGELAESRLASVGGAR